MNQRVKESPRDGRPLLYGEVLFDRFPDDASVLGGAPFNVAWHLQGFGLQPLLISAVGQDTQGEKVLQTMCDWGMDCQGIQIDPIHPTGVVNITLNNGQPTFTIVAEQAYDFILPEAVEDIIHRESISLLYHGSLISRSQISRDTLSLLQQRINKPVFVDVNLREPWWENSIVDELLKRASWLKINDAELVKLTADDNALQPLQHAARNMFDRYQLDLLIVTCGARGAFIVGKDEMIDGEPVMVKEVADTVGAGDAFSAVTLLGLIKGWSYADTLQRALQFASQLCTVRGATLQDKVVYTDLLQQWQ